ncbi:hypothetical protein QYF61_003561 [Mycteria americana]|uniref:Uncharacterized protein n=1 Tax=Mycteria americana TaxID=33587 RepID=A0AAN7RQT8_MYCAM|nr:hypothetical protein QYF61_003561 [Mycteria americana]
MATDKDGKTGHHSGWQPPVGETMLISINTGRTEASTTAPVPASLPQYRHDCHCPSTSITAIGITGWGSHSEIPELVLHRLPHSLGPLCSLVQHCLDLIQRNPLLTGHLGQSDHEMTEFLICGEAARGVSKTATLDFRRADFGLFRRLVERVPWEAALMGKGVQEGWTFFREEVLKAQDQAVPRCRKTSRRGRRPAWLTRELWLELRKKRRVYDLWKKGQATQEDYKGVARLCREKIRRAKAELELSLATAVKDNKNTSSNTLAAEGELRRICSPYRANCSLGTQPPELEVRDEVQNGAPIIQGEMVSDLLHHLDIHKSMGPDEIHLRVLKELADVLTKPLSIIYQQSWLTGEVPAY